MGLIWLVPVGVLVVTAIVVAGIRRHATWRRWLAAAVILAIAAVIAFFLILEAVLANIDGDGRVEVTPLLAGIGVAALGVVAAAWIVLSGRRRPYLP